MTGRCLCQMEFKPWPKNRQTHARISAISRPHLAELTDKVLFGDVWENPVLSPRDRSLVTITSLISLYRTNETAVSPEAGSGERRHARRNH